MRYRKTYVCRKRSMVEWYRQAKTKVLGPKSVPMPLWPPQISHTHFESNPGLLPKWETNRLKPWARPLHDRTECTSHSVQWRTQEFFFLGGGFNKFSWGQRGRGSGGGSPLVRGSRGSCNLVQEISFHIVKFS